MIYLRVVKTLSLLLAGLTLFGGIVKADGDAEPADVERLEVTDRDMLAALNLMPANGTLAFSLSDPAEHRRLEFALQPGNTQCLPVPRDLFSDFRLRQFSKTAAPEFPADQPSWVTVKRTAECWTVYLNDIPVARMPELWEGPMKISHPKAESPAEDAADDYTQKLGRIDFADNFLVPAGSEFPATWEKMSGIWKLHSVTGSISGASGGYQLARQPRPEKSPNFYTMEGGGTNALVLAGEPFYSHYAYRAAVQHNCGTNGLAFLAGERGGYYCFTAQTDQMSDRLILELWRQPPQKDSPPEYLDAVQTELPAGQWLALEVRLFDDRVVCLADNIEVIRRKSPLPPGGRFGLFANTPDGETTRFDDVVAYSHEDSSLETPEDVLAASHSELNGISTFYHRNKSWLYFPENPDIGKPEYWTTGAPNGSPKRIEAHFVSPSPNFMVGLTSGATNDTSPYYRFTCEQQDGRRIFTLDEVSRRGFAFRQDRYEVNATNREVMLSLDALRPHELRAIADGRTVCFARPKNQPGGLQGILAAAEDGVFAQVPEIKSHESALGERFEKNPLYVNDPFMRHWASPEGQWVTFPDGLTWFKGDVIGPMTIRLPVVDKMVLHLCVPETGSNGLCRVSVETDKVNVFTPDSGDNPAFSVPVGSIPEVTVDKANLRLYTIGINGSVLWLGGEEILLGMTHLNEPPAGRRIRITGMALENLARTLVKRDNVFDTLFTESLFNWTINGGRWEVINRFYCEPTWSHMNGESQDSLAALWSKYVFSGDFSIEFYAGMRMGWYARPGDLNLTVMSKQQSTGDGYTAIATGWDPDHSQLYSRLLRNGKPMDISTKYLVPRSREGLVRHGYQPLVAKGRDIHGAWYGMQLRRIGKHLKYIYDNEEVFNVDDEEPLNGGSLGIWTFKNSMMVARIKIAAESIKPRPFNFHAIEPGVPPAPEPTPPPDSGLRVNGRTVQLLSPLHWESFDTVSHPAVKFSGLDTAHPEMRVTSILGGGTFLTRCTMPPAETNKVLGWRFEFAHHPKARVNFEFSSCVPDKSGKLVPSVGYSYVLTGSDETRGPRKIIGKAEELPATENGAEPVWTKVEIWVPAEIISASLPVLIEGFGNLQPSDVVQGIEGNPPHAWFAVRNFREIARGVPVVTGPAEKRNEVAELTKIIHSLKPGELQMLEVPETLDPHQPVLEWAVPEQANFGLHAVADAAIPGSIVVAPTHPWPSPLLPPKQITVDTKPASFITEDNGIRVLVPLEVLRPDRMTLALQLNDGRYFRQVVPMQQDTETATNRPPVLLGFEMPEGGIETFEKRPTDPKPYQESAIASIDYSDPDHGGILKISNRGTYGRRLRSYLKQAYDPVATPLLQFRYRGDPMAHAAISIGGDADAFSFTEAYRTHVRYTQSKLAPVDNQWHTWIGIPTDNGGSKPLAARTKVPTAALRIGSRGSADQTGLHSFMMIDDLAFGPAVGPNRVLAFKADYSDPDGIAKVQYAIVSGPTPYEQRPADEQAKTVWIACKNGEVTQPDMDKIPDGIHHLLSRAQDSKGAWSIPSDVPFFMDRAAPQLTAQDAEDSGFNGRKLTVTITDPVSPPTPNTVQFAVLGRVLNLAEDFGTMSIGEGTITYTIDWVWMLRKELANAKDGDVLPLQISGVTDVSGNLRPPELVNLKLDLSKDKRPPTVPTYDVPTNLFWYLPAFYTYDAAFTGYRNVSGSTMATPDGNVLNLAITAAKEKPYVQKAFTAPNTYDPDKFPWMAISFRIPEGEFPTAAPFTVNFHPGKRRPGGIKDVHSLDPADSACQKFLACKPRSEWKTGEWIDLLLNVHDFLAAESSEKKDAPDVAYITIFFNPDLVKRSVQLRSIALMSPWSSNSLFAFRPYDISGMRGLVWDGGETQLTGIRPAYLTASPGTAYAFRFRFADRSGNMSDTQTIPLPPGSKADNATLKPFEKVEY